MSEFDLISDSLAHCSYETSYPRTRVIRWWYVAKEMLAFGACQVAIAAVMANFIQVLLFLWTLLFEFAHLRCVLVTGLLCFQLQLPVQRLLARPESPSALDYVFTWTDLMLPSILVWILGFYSFFHCFLNAFAEIARFADRTFYLDWWNANSLSEFWYYNCLLKICVAL